MYRVPRVSRRTALLVLPSTVSGLSLQLTATATTAARRRYTQPMMPESDGDDARRARDDTPERGSARARAAYAECGISRRKRD